MMLLYIYIGIVGFQEYVFGYFFECTFKFVK